MFSYTSPNNFPHYNNQIIMKPFTGFNIGTVIPWISMGIRVLILNVLRLHID